MTTFSLLDYQLIEAVSEGSAADVRAAVEAGADVNARDPRPELVLSEQDRPTALILAVRRGDRDVAEALLDAGADPDVRWIAGQTALMEAAGDDRTEMVELLIRYGADVNAQDRFGNTALSRAVSNDARGAFDKLVARGAEIDRGEEDGRTPLVRAAERGNIRMIERILDLGAEIDAKDRHGRTPLIRAAEAAGPEAVEALLARGADPSEVDRWNVTAADAAEARGDPAVRRSAAFRRLREGRRERFSATEVVLRRIARSVAGMFWKIRLALSKQVRTPPKQRFWRKP